jgi:hypothetical protein
MTGLIYFSVLVPGFNMVSGSTGVIHSKGWVLRPDLIIPILGSGGEGGGKGWFLVRLDWYTTEI